MIIDPASQIWEVGFCCFRAINDQRYSSHNVTRWQYQFCYLPYTSIKDLKAKEIKMVDIGHFPVSAIITFILCGLIVIISIRSIYSRRSFAIKDKPVSPLTNLAPGAVISLGIFGTFLGIYIGLLNFDTTDINNSIPDLLEGRVLS
jgi:hypothetical protein